MRTYSQNCPNCAAPLQFRKGTLQLNCAHCGSGYRVVVETGTVTLHDLQATADGIRRGVDRTSAELQFARLQKELAQIERVFADRILPQAYHPGPFRFMSAFDDLLGYQRRKRKLFLYIAGAVMFYSMFIAGTGRLVHYAVALLIVCAVIFILVREWIDYDRRVRDAKRMVPGVMAAFDAESAQLRNKRDLIKKDIARCREVINDHG